MHKNLVIIFSVAFCLLCVRCAKVTEGPAPAVRVNDPRAPYATIRYNNVVFVDKSLARWIVETRKVLGWPVKHKVMKSKIAVEDQGWQFTETGNREVWATFRNRTDYPLQLECRVHFFSDAKVPIEEPTTWQRVFLLPNSVASYKEKSTRKDVEYYYTEVREGR